MIKDDYMEWDNRNIVGYDGFLFNSCPVLPCPGNKVYER